MAHTDIVAIFSATEDRPMAPLFGSNVVVHGKRVLISALGANFDRVDVLQALKELIVDQKQLIVWKSSTLEPLSLDLMTFEEIEAATQFKATNESSSLLGDSILEYNNLKAQYLSATNDQEQAGVLILIKELCFTATLENLASNALKGFGSFMHEPSGIRVFLLDNRKLYTFDQARVRTISNAISKENARAAKLSAQDETKLDSECAKKPKSSKRKSKKTVHNKAASEDDQDEDESAASTSSVSIPCEGTHTDSEEDEQLSGNNTPIIQAEEKHVPKTATPIPPTFNIGSLFASSSRTADFQAQSKQKQKKLKKKDKKPRVSKPKKQPKKSSKKDKRSRTRKHKKHSSRHRVSSSSSESAGEDYSSESSSSSKSSSSDQVLYMYYYVMVLYYYLLLYLYVLLMYYYGSPMSFSNKLQSMWEPKAWLSYM